MPDFTPYPDGSDLARSRGTDLLFFDEFLTDGERALRDEVRAFCDTEVARLAPDYWERGEFSRELLTGYAGLGIAGITIDGYGCRGMSALASGMIMAELARGDGSLATLHTVHSGVAMGSIYLLGDDEQRDRWLPGMARAESLGAFALTEPTHGSDVVSMETRAVRDGDEWVLTGEKRWIGNGTTGDIIVVLARDDAGEVGAFVVESPNDPDSPTRGWDARVIDAKIAIRGVWQAHIRLDGVRIPARNRLAHANTFADISRVLIASRPSVAWEALGHAIAAYEGALTYALRREQFGSPLAGFQLVQEKLATMAAEISATQALLVRIAQLQTQERTTLELAAMAKFHAARMARKVVALARDILGGNGILIDHHVARHLADMEAVFTYEGSDTVQALILGRSLTGRSAFA